MPATVVATPVGVAPPPRRRPAVASGTGRPRPPLGSAAAAAGVPSMPVQEAAIPATYNLTPADGAGPPTRELRHFVVTRLVASAGGPAGMPASLCELDDPEAVLAAGGVLAAPGLPPLTVSLPSVAGWAVELGEEPRVVVTTPHGRYVLTGRPAGSYVAAHRRARRRYELLVRSVALATHLPPADATYAKVVRQLGRRVAGMRAYSEADVLADAPFLLAQGRVLEDPALRCSLFAQELSRRAGCGGGRTPTGVPLTAGGRSRPTSPGLQLPGGTTAASAFGAGIVAVGAPSSAACASPFFPLSPPVRPSAAKPPTLPRAGSPGTSPRRASLSPPTASTPPLPVAMRPPLPPSSPVSPPLSPVRRRAAAGAAPPALARPAGGAPAGGVSKKRKRPAAGGRLVGGAPAAKRRLASAAVAAPEPQAPVTPPSVGAGVVAADAPVPCACGGAPGGCGGGSPAAAGSKYASDACGMARARQRVAEMAAAGVDVDSFVRVHVEPLSAGSAR